MNHIIVFSADRYQDYPLNKDVNLGSFKIVSKKDKVYYIVSDKETEMKSFCQYEEGGISFMLFQWVEKIYRKEKEEILIHPVAGDIRLKNKQFIFHDNLLLNPEENEIFINGLKISEKTIHIQMGDLVFIDDLIMINQITTFKIVGNHKSYQTELFKIIQSYNHLQYFPNYRRSPRIIKRVMTEKESILTAPEKEKSSKGELVGIIITPLISIAATIAVGIIMSRGIYVYIMAITSILSTVFSITKYFSNRKQIKENNKKKEDVYNRYLLKVRSRLQNIKKKEEESYQYHYPRMKEIELLMNQYSSRIYEKDMSDDDFLCLSMGSSKEKSCIDIEITAKELEVEENEYSQELNEIKNIFSIVEDKPLVVDLKKAHLGLVGDTEDIHKQIHQMLMQITFFHSYHDVEIILLYNESYRKQFDYTKWYPHVRISAINVVGNIYLEKVRDQVLGSLAQILKQRKEKRDERKKESAYLPHYLIFIDDYFLVMNHSIMEYLQEETTSLGFTLIFSAKQKADLPENIRTVILVEDSRTNHVLLNEGVVVDKNLFSPQIQGISLEKVARNLSVLEHQKGVHSQIPESVTFFNMYEVEHPKELNILERWNKNQSHKTLSVPLGLRAEKDIVHLDLHEKAHGPHGLVAGTTGSGKSEILQSYILSLAVNFHPHEVGFLLIDYKGGGMANLFQRLPHLLGTITNLDGGESMRALASIKSELKRRQRIFNEHGVNNIINYNQLFKAGGAKEPLPTLFLISDEFAELKKEQPEFMSELVSVARIGRTLGIKLILATQKPSGVVDDQIWSNSKFKLALKVQDEGDSKEIIKTTDAAYLTQPGRAYLQVGNNEIYELFQSAWSGAIYYQEEEDDLTDQLVYKINEIGQQELINKDLSGGLKTEATVSKTQLDVTIEYIDELYQNLNMVEVRKPWLAPLTELVVTPIMRKEQKDTTQNQVVDLNCSIGIVDIPEQQIQKDYNLDFRKEGNLAIFASAGFGKSFTLGIIMMSLAYKNPASLLHYYIIDLGNSALIPYAELPHTADYMAYDATEKILKFMKLIQKLIRERKQLLAKEMVQNFETYNQLHLDNPLHSIMIFVDNYDVVKEMEMPFDDFISKVTRDGPGLGIYVVITASKSTALRYAVLSNFKNRIVQYLYDRSEANAMIGRSSYQLPEIKGRGLVKLENVNMMQVYSLFEFEDNLEYLKKSKQLISTIKNSYLGDVPNKIPVLPEILTSLQLIEYERNRDIKVVAGLCVEEVELVDAGIEASPYLIIGPQRVGKTNLLELYLNQMMKEGKCYIFDDNQMYFMKYSKQENINYIQTEEEVNLFIQILAIEIQNRLDAFQVIMEKEITSPKQYYAQMDPFIVLIEDVDQFVTRIGKKYAELLELLKNAGNVRIQIIATGQAGKMKGFDDFTKYFKTAIHGVVLGNQGTNTVFPVSNTKEYPVFGEGLLFNNGLYQRIRIPKFVEREE